MADPGDPENPHDPELSEADSSSKVKASSSIDDTYQQWKSGYEANGGDSDVHIALGNLRGTGLIPGLSGTAVFDLLEGRGSVTLSSGEHDLEVWIVDNQGSGSAMPDAGDSYSSLGLVSAGDGEATLDFDVGPDFFTETPIDLVAVTLAGETPDEGYALLGTRSYFERKYTMERTGGSSGRRPSPPPEQSPPESQVDPRVALGLVSPEVLEGGRLFFDETFDGNGRTCGSCHPSANNLALDAHFVASRRRSNPDDGLFASENATPGTDLFQLERHDLLNDFALILENVDGLEDPTNKFTMRGVPHSLSMATSITRPPGDGPTLGDGTTTAVVQRTGWSGDGSPAPGTLRMFSTGAVIQHATKDFDRQEPGSFRLPNDDELDKMEAYMLSTGRTNELDLSVVEMTDPDAEAGRQLFMTNVGGAKCNGCHGNAGANLFGTNSSFANDNERIRIPEVDAQGIPFDGGFGGQGLDEPNFDANGDGINDSFGNGLFNTPPLIEAADTGPFFHHNASETIEDAVAFYSTETFNQSPGGLRIAAIFGEGIGLTTEQNDQVAAFLRALNASFNVDMAVQRIEAAVQIEDEYGRNAQFPLSDTLIWLAGAELNDAHAVARGPFLWGSDTGRSFRHQIEIAFWYMDLATITYFNSPEQRRQALQLALQTLSESKEQLGTGMEFTLGEGNLVFEGNGPF